MSWSGGKDPNAILLGRVVVREVGTGELSLGSSDFMFTPTFFTIMAIVMEDKACVHTYIFE